MADVDLNKKRPKEIQTKKDPPEAKPVVKGKTTIQKKGLGEKFSETFFSADLQTVKQSVLFDILIPAAKDMLSDMTKGLIDGLLYGERRSSRVSRDRSRDSGVRVYRSYDAYSDERPRRRTYDDDVPWATSRARVENLLFETREDAENVRKSMIRHIEDYGVASIKDLYIYAEMKTDYTKEKYGWYDFRSSTVERVREGFLLRVPKPVVIDD